MSSQTPVEMPGRVSIQTADFDLSDEISALRARDARVGAVCSFVGTVRDRNRVYQSGAKNTQQVVREATEQDQPRISAMELEHYPGMTERAIEAMIDQAHARFDIFAARVVHRVGLLQPLDQIVLVAVTSAHRGESFQACEFLMDYLKTQAPFWKKETTPEGAHWVDARVSDDAALARWGIEARNA
jgi:molybdopterin synthase catalytic subunit